MFFVCVIFGANFAVRSAYALEGTETPATVIVNPDGCGEEDRKWQGIPSMDITDGGRIWVSYLTGGEKEPSLENFVAYAYSDDGGKTWNNPFFIVKHQSEGLRAYDPSVWKDPDNRIWFTWCQARGNYRDLKNWAIVLDNPDGTPEQMEKELTTKNPEMLSDGVKLNRITTLNNGDWIFFTAATNPTAITVWGSSDKGENWSRRSVVGGNGYKVTEPIAVQKEDGEICLLTRIERVDGALAGRGIGRAYSKDNGYTWSEYQAELEEPFRGPASRFAFQKLQSGHLLFINNESETSRTKLTAYLSVDDGKSWNYKCLLDERAEVSYPCSAQDSDGNIYVIYDKGRYAEKEIRITKFTEQDIIDGNILSDNSSVRIAVSILGDQKDIENVLTEFPETITVERGTLISEARKNLPTEMKVSDKDGNEYVLSGKWTAENYDAEKAGVYLLKFSATTDSLVYKVYDAHNLMQIKLIVEGKDGCNGNLNGTDGFIFVLTTISCVCLLISAAKKNRKQGDIK